MACPLLDGSCMNDNDNDNENDSDNELSPDALASVVGGILPPGLFDEMLIPSADRLTQSHAATRRRTSVGSSSLMGPLPKPVTHRRRRVGANVGLFS
jgi:hypothetical protein